LPPEQFRQALARARGLSLRRSLGESPPHDGASFLKAKALSFVATIAGDSLAKLRPELVGTDFFSRSMETLKQLESEVGSLRLRQRKGSLEKLILGDAHELIMTGRANRDKSAATQKRGQTFA
jgi:hypothetical protein